MVENLRVIGIVEIVLSAFFISLVVTVLTTLLSNKFHIFIDKIDSNKPQGIHSLPTPRAGGIGIFLGFCLLFLNITPLNLYFFIGLFIVFLSGLLEDFSSALSPKTRLLIQFFGSSIAIFGTNAIITNLSPIPILPYYIGIAFSLFGIIGVCNSINIIDGLNGLAGGICLMAFAAIGIAAFMVDSDFVLFISLIGIGSILGFLVLNFPKGKIFLGDGGAYMLGFIIALLLAILTQNDSGISAWFGLSLMIYPVWEVLFSIIRRKTFDKRPSTQPDKKHLHFLIYQKIQNNPVASGIIWLLNLPFMIASIVFMYQAWILISLCLSFMIIYILIYIYLSYNPSKQAI